MNSNEPNKCRFSGRGRFLKIPFFLAFALLKGAAIFFLWNQLVPELFHGPTLTYLQALELMILAKLLVGFGGFRGGRHHHGGPFGRGRWMAMSEEERTKMREEIRKRCES